ncbi:hypothetical protein [Burkholderia ubonensis]|uniref:hypothetical protein n=1 Tax=Burkholderia ubonensis TaxID=101571 RepID=UPI00075EF8F2|nr:hypothetical protein [Burkholderia ubonensis]KVP16875.1 hypothetical protein WJ84_00960 [Burkholderia ubonensis]KVP40003.1 hypothetical protein WJ87_07420 [Burkholderia ubonensis]
MRCLKTLALVALLASSAAHAEFLDRVDLKPAIVSGFVSHHINVHKRYNENNYGMGYRFGQADVMVGYYRNSDDKNSVYAAYEARWKLTNNLQLGVIAGGVTGYKIAVTPLLLPELVTQVGGLELAVTYAPKVHSQIPALVAVQGRWAW